jgi:hypothetical protein
VWCLSCWMCESPDNEVTSSASHSLLDTTTARMEFVMLGVTSPDCSASHLLLDTTTYLHSSRLEAHSLTLVLMLLLLLQVR